MGEVWWGTMAAERRVPAIVLAGGTGGEEVARACKVPHKALVPVGGELTLWRVARALQEARRVEGVVVVAHLPEVAVACPPGVPCARPAGVEFLDTIRAGMAQSPEADFHLLATSDLPLLTPAAVDDFLEQALDSGADLCYSMVERAQLLDVPGVEGRTFVHLREGAFSGGNLALVSRAFVEGQAERLTRAFAGRKSPVALARLFGLSFTWRLLWRRLDVSQLLARAKELLGVPVMVVSSRFPEVCYDLDEVENVTAAERMLAQR